MSNCVSGIVFDEVSFLLRKNIRHHEVGAYVILKQKKKNIMLLFSPFVNFFL